MDLGNTKDIVNSESAILVGIQLPGKKDWEIDYSLDELGQLATTAGAKVIGKVIQSKPSRHPKTFIGRGKAEELKEMLRDIELGMVIFDDELTPSQQLNLEMIIDKKIIDRTGLILDIFSQHAHSSEGKIQVELAQMNYYLPRLKGLGIEMSRLGGGIGTRGPGETKLETDRRRLNKRIQQLKDELKSLSKVRNTQRQKRKKQDVFTISLVGYTNTGKSTLLNRLTDAGVLVEDRLFATLDSTSRKLNLPSKKEAVISDTVGFIDKLPHELVAAFKSTLDEVRYSQLILHVIDASNPQKDLQMKSVNSILKELGVEDIPRLDIYNKADEIDEPTIHMLNRQKSSIAISAKADNNIDKLFEAIDQEMSSRYLSIKFKIPYSKGSVRKEIFEKGIVLSEENDEKGSTILVEMRPEVAERYAQFLVQK